LSKLLVTVLLIFPISSAFAADAGHGRVLAQRHCSICHTIAPDLRSEVADAPPFEVIGRKHNFDPSSIAAAIVGPHPRMNFAPAIVDAGDIAAYIATLSR
jgi:mono/diheme cytochrome c family protein